MTITVHQILFQHMGANADTRREPVAVWAGQVDLSEQVSRCMSYDSDMQVNVDLYAVYPVALPEWLRPEEWIKNHVDFGYAWARGVTADMPETWVRKLMTLGGVSVYVCCKLLKTKTFRSEFRKSLRAQLENWLGGGSDYSSPFSDRQWESLITKYDSKSVKDLDDRCYREKRSLMGVVPADEVTAPC